jgi:type I restriction enzyme R subunit
VANSALSGFVHGRTLTADQHDFIALVVEHLTANGAMDVGLLYEPPFTSVAAGGPESLFPDADIEALIAAVRAVGANVTR